VLIAFSIRWRDSRTSGNHARGGLSAGAGWIDVTPVRLPAHAELTRSFASTIVQVSP
jgi:hypothetical protein